MKAPIFGHPGLPIKDFNLALDTYLATGQLNADEFAAMNTDQANVIREVSKSIRRINYKNKPTNYESTQAESI